jgi:uncharacterized protein YqhQ
MPVEGAPRFDVGGQAVIEGVMMRSPRSFAVVCRRPDGSIVIKESAWQPLWAGSKFLRLPFLRGSVVLLESLMNGMSALSFSADQQLIGEPEGKATADAKAKPGVSSTTPQPKSLGAMAAGDPGEGSGELSAAAKFGMIAMSLAFGLALFVGVPHLLSWLLGRVLGFDSSSFLFHAVDGVIKMALLVSYLALISLMPDIRRVFQYHGAEHKSIFTYELGLPLTVENARRQTRFHPRCGTSFLLIVVMVSVVLFAAALSFEISDSALVDNVAKILIKIPLMFPVAGLAYELIKLAGKHCQTSRLARWASAPGMWLQKITTREPTDEQLEVALVSIRKTLWRERTADAPPLGKIEVYRSAAEIDLPVA